MEELRRFADGEKPLFAGAANATFHAIERFREFLDTKHMGSDREPDPRELAASGLFGFHSLHIDNDGTPEEAPRLALDVLLSTGQPEALESAFERHLEAGDIGAARRIVNWIESEELLDAEKLQNRLDESLDLETEKLLREMGETGDRVEHALVLGHISDAERSRHDAVLVELERRLAESRVLRFDLERAKLQKIVGEVDQGLMAQKERAEAELDSLELPSDSAGYKQISRAIAQEDIITANELLGRVRSTGSLPPTEKQSNEKRQVFEAFYPERSRAIEKALEELVSPRQVLEQIGKGSEFAGMRLHNVPGAQRQSAVKMLEAWFTLKRDGGVKNRTEENVKALCSELGFIMRKVTVIRSGRNFGKVDIETDPVHAREHCPIPAFGSSADGRYHLVFLWGRPTEEDILQHADAHSGKRATIILYFGRLSEARRKALARITRDRSRTLIVLDELLLVFLCGERDSRMPPLFACAVPFTYVQPYVTTAGLVPPEMFYGREQEMREIADPRGPVFIYGGRQLGKTALLREVERREHQPKKDSYAVWIDLKGEGIGYDRGTADIWPAIWRVLRGISAIPDGIKEPNNKKRINSFIDGLCSQFNNSAGRALLLLLDEADRFLEVDARDPSISARGYRESSRLKALMDRTGRSIKVVFAGLHNVLRTAKGSNHPLGHFGVPIEVGPLAWRTTEELVRQPLLASGYRFKHDSLVTRILAQTNYYPSLIQLYGSALIKAMGSRRVTGIPLYDIDERILDETYQNTNLRDSIRSRFQWTLQLDPRYEVIAYSIAHQCVEEKGLLEAGIDRRRIDDAVGEWWPQGFEDVESYTVGFWSLLDEMVGLGVLRSVGEAEDGRYTLRNPNVLLLMGTKEEIEDNLLTNRELPQEFERELFRAHHPQKSDGPSRSPLTFQQEDHLRAERNGVSVVCGLRASGSDDVLLFLKARAADDSVVELKNLIDLPQFDKALERLSQRPEGTTIYVVPDSVPWSERWVQVALGRVRKLRAKDRYTQIVFMTDPKHLWQLLPELEKLDREGLQQISLRPWRKEFLRRWMDDVGFGNDPDIREQIAERTGGWKVLLERLYALKQETGDLKVSLEKLKKEFDDENVLQQQLQRFGLDGLEVQNALRYLAGLGEATFEDLKMFVDDHGVDGDTLQRCLNWAKLLHLVRRAGGNMWKMDPIAARVLQRVGG